MKKLTTQDWSAIARYLKEEASPADLIRINNLIDNNPGLKGQLESVSKSFSEPQDQSHVFNTEKAFEKLNEKFIQENLI